MHSIEFVTVRFGFEHYSSIEQLHIFHFGLLHCFQSVDLICSSHICLWLDCTLGSINKLVLEPSKRFQLVIILLGMLYIYSTVVEILGVDLMNYSFVEKLDIYHFVDFRNFQRVDQYCS